MADIAVCTDCGAKNRLASKADKIPVCGRCRTSLPWLVDAADATFDAELASPLPVLVDFWASWCRPCLVMAPALEGLAEDLAGRLKVVKLNVEQNPATQARFRIHGFPTLLLFRDGKEIERIVGARSKAELASIVQPHL